MGPELSQVVMQGQAEGGGALHARLQGRACDARRARHVQAGCWMAMFDVCAGRLMQQRAQVCSWKPTVDLHRAYRCAQYMHELQACSTGACSTGMQKRSYLVHLQWAERMHVDVRRAMLGCGQQLQVGVPCEVGVDAALHAHLCAHAHARGWVKGCENPTLLWGRLKLRTLTMTMSRP